MFGSNKVKLAARWQVILSCLFIALFFLSLSIGEAQAAPENIQVLFVIPPPPTACVGQLLPISFTTVRAGPAFPAPLAQIQTSLGSPAPTVIMPVGLLYQFTYKADQPGSELIQIQIIAPDGSLGMAAYPLVIQDCPYHVQISIIENYIGSTNVQGGSIYNGEGTFSISNNGQLSGAGQGDLFVNVSVNSGADYCTADPPIVGSGPFTISGSAPTGLFDYLSLNLAMDPIPWQNSTISCGFGGANMSFPMSTFFQGPAWQPQATGFSGLQFPTSGGTVEYPVTLANGMLKGTTTITVERSNLP